MRRALVLVFSLVSAACGGNSATPPDAPPDPPMPDAEVAPVFRNPVALPDAELATKALELLGANVPNARQSCNECHGMTRQHLSYWRALSDTSMTTCITDLAVSSPESARTMIDCMRSMPAVGTSDFQTKKLGVVATATSLPWFEFTFRKAFGADAAAQMAVFQKQVGMPRGTTVPQFTQAEFDLVAEWFARGLPQLEAALPQDPPPNSCDPAASSDVGAHVAAMKTAGWRALNKTNLMAMHGCGAATDPRACLADVPLGVDQPFGAGWDLAGRGRLRLLADVTYSTSYWTRSSADGRFIGAGVRNVPGSYIYDLQRGTTVSISALYDPGFFPDNSGFVFQGGQRNVCAMSLLTSNPAAIATTEAGCSNISSIGLYQHVGRALGGDFFAIDSEFVSDDGGHEATLGDPDTFFGPNGYVSFIPMLFDGTKFTSKPQVSIKTPFEGDTVLSPSARMIISRVAGPNDRQLGFVLRKVNATMSGASYTVTAPEVARYCVSGGKPAFSFDERWIAYHHYVTAADAVELGFTDAADPAFQPYLTSGAANVYLLELATGETKRITNVAPGQYALYPHFRSDGWIYAQIRDTNTNHEYMVASDAALIAEQ
ncbi:MAG: putative glycoside hydrolase [Deltaproteobacteria bacterium]|nr:putative glycoside hydrolase [Deltaproteobacteria bacterium]